MRRIAVAVGGAALACLAGCAAEPIPERSASPVKTESPRVVVPASASAARLGLPGQAIDAPSDCSPMPASLVDEIWGGEFELVAFDVETIVWSDAPGTDARCSYEFLPPGADWPTVVTVEFIDYPALGDAEEHLAFIASLGDTAEAAGYAAATVPGLGDGATVVAGPGSANFVSDEFWSDQLAVRSGSVLIIATVEQQSTEPPEDRWSRLESLLVTGLPALASP